MYVPSFYTFHVTAYYADIQGRIEENTNHIVMRNAQYSSKVNKSQSGVAIIHWETHPCIVGVTDRGLDLLHIPHVEGRSGQMRRCGWAKREKNAWDKGVVYQRESVSTKTQGMNQNQSHFTPRKWMHQMESDCKWVIRIIIFIKTSTFYHHIHPLSTPQPITNQTEHPLPHTPPPWIKRTQHSHISA